MVWEIGEKNEDEGWDIHTHIHIYNQNIFYACMNTLTIKIRNMLSIEYNPKWMEPVYFSVVLLEVLRSEWEYLWAP